MQSHTIRVLFIDDDEDDYLVVRDLLSDIHSKKFILKWVSDYGAALDAILSGEFDVCLLDYRLKARNGLELIREATAAGCDRPVIFLTGQGDYGVDTEAMRSGAADYLVKVQLTTDMLERSIRYSIARKNAERELKSYQNRLEGLVKERTGQLETANGRLLVEIAEHKRTEEAWRESRDFLDKIVNLTSDPIYVVDRQHRYILANGCPVCSRGPEA